ncbi:MAG: glycosyltransferase family 39 protein [Flavobacteriales bacterium]
MYGWKLTLALGALLLVLAAGAMLDVMGVDAAQYAGMARDMLSLDHRPADATWLKLYYRGNNYLDKPPLLFWLSALSFKLFGVHNWSYKLPSILYALLGMYATYRFAKLHYPDALARTAALMFGSSVAFVLMTNDVRTDTMLMGSVMAAIWLGSAWIEQRRWWQLVGCAVAIASGMLAKGPMGLMAPALALGGHVLLARRLDVLRDIRWALVLPLVAVLLVPMCIGLYEQHGIQGIRFYFWEQSFGRITGENRWKDDSTFLFFSHEVLWQLLPWTVFLLAGLWLSFKALWKRTALPEYVSISGVFLVFTAISLSQFKLPHYLYVILPLFSVIAAWGWHSVLEPWVMRVHAMVLLILWCFALVLVLWSFPDGGLPFAALLVAVALLAVFYLRQHRDRNGVFLLGFHVFMAIAITLNGHFYPELLRYQGNAQAGKWAAKQGLGINNFYGMQLSGSALDFYAGYPVHWLSNAEEAARVIAPGVVVYTDLLRKQELEEAGFVPKEILPVMYYDVQLLGSEFLVPEQRTDVLRQHYLLRF